MSSGFERWLAGTAREWRVFLPLDERRSHCPRIYSDIFTPGHAESKPIWHSPRFGKQHATPGAAQSCAAVDRQSWWRGRIDATFSNRYCIHVLPNVTIPHQITLQLRVGRHHGSAANLHHLLAITPGRRAPPQAVSTSHHITDATSLEEVDHLPELPFARLLLRPARLGQLRRHLVLLVEDPLPAQLALFAAVERRRLHVLQQTAEVVQVAAVDALHVQLRAAVLHDCGRVRRQRRLPATRRTVSADFVHRAGWRAAQPRAGIEFRRISRCKTCIM